MEILKKYIYLAIAVMALLTCLISQYMVYGALNRMYGVMDSGYHIIDTLGVMELE
jgi:hypothetical protein